MSDLDELAPLEAELRDAEQLVCPACRLAQSPDHDACQRCGADLALLAGALREAAERRRVLYRALLDGDTIGALTQLDRIVQLTGPSLELAALRKMIRGSIVPIEVVSELREEAESELEPGDVYRDPQDGDPLTPPLDPLRQVYDQMLDDEPAAVVFAAPEPEAEVTVTVSTADEGTPAAGEPAVEVRIDGAPLDSAPRPSKPAKLPLAFRLLANPKRALAGLVIVLLVVAAALVGLGYAVGLSVAGR